VGSPEAMIVNTGGRTRTSAGVRGFLWDRHADVIVFPHVGFRCDFPIVDLVNLPYLRRSQFHSLLPNRSSVLFVLFQFLSFDQIMNAKDYLGVSPFGNTSCWGK